MTHPPETVDSDTFVLSIHGQRIAARSTGSGDPVLPAQRLVPPDGELDVFRRRASRDNWHRIGWSRGLRERNSGRPVLDADVVGCRWAGPRCSRHGESGCRRVVPRRRSRTAARGRPCRTGEPAHAAVDFLWCRCRSRPRPRCTPHLAGAEPRNTVAPNGSVGLALQDRGDLDLVQHSRFGCIDASTLVICGDRDTAVPPATSRLLAARIRNARLNTIQAGHDLQKPGPAAIVAQLVERFLDSETSVTG